MTPIHTCRTLDAMSGRSLFFKCELFQRGGAFKFRGALNAVRQLGDECRDVVTHSSGNHAAAIALAAAASGRVAHVVMPRDAPQCKRNAVEGYGARVTTCEPTAESRVATADRVQAGLPGSVQIPSYNHPAIIAGQGTVGLELLQQVPGLDALVVPVGGGGLIAGICVAAKGLNPRIRIFAAEPMSADDCARSLASGRRIPLDAAPKTVADGLKTSLGTLTWPIIQEHVEAVITVSEDDIIAATRLVWERMKLVIEPSASGPNGCSGDGGRTDGCNSAGWGAHCGCDRPRVCQSGRRGLPARGRGAVRRQRGPRPSAVGGDVECIVRGASAPAFFALALRAARPVGRAEGRGGCSTPDGG